MATKRQVFYSFHYQPDCWRTSMVRNIGAIEGNKEAPDNDWEAIVHGGDAAIQKWIDGQLKYRSCTVVLVGTQTAGRKWINYEIFKSWNENMGVVGICIHGLKNSDGYISNKGTNPFDHVTFKATGQALSTVAKWYDPPGTNSRERYDWIARNISAAIEEAITIRRKN